MRTLLWLLCLAGLAIAPVVVAFDEADIPTDAPNDAVMAGPGEIQEMLDWASAAFTGSRPAGREPLVRVEVIRQDHSVLRFGQSCVETPLKIGTRQFERGLGTHANSQILLHLPPGATTFQASVGIDNNFDTGGRRGECLYPVLQTGLRALNAEASYLVDFIDEARVRTRRTRKGRELGTDFELRLPQKRSSLLIRYQPAPRD